MAFNNIDEDMSIKARILTSSIQDHYISKAVGQKRGPACVLICDKEADLKLYLLKMHNLGHPLTRDRVKLIVA